MNTLLDSKEGMQLLADWARAHSFVLQPFHEQLAKKHGVSLDGIAISRPIPAEQPAKRGHFRK